MVQEVAAAGDERIIISPDGVSHSSTTQTSSLNPLKCPRCASSNTKFCYYNNYNLTQPRHFCKTCRRYWTKGGALRNVPIGGGCRKNNNKTVIPSSLGKLPFTGKFTRQYPLPVSSSHEMGKTSTNSTDHLLALLRSTQNQNPNPNQIMSNGSAGGLCLDPLNTQIMSSFWPNYEAELQQQNMNAYFNTGHYADQHNYYNQRFAALKSSQNYYLDNYGAAILVGNVHASSSNSSEILESAPVVAGGESGHCWNNITSLNSSPDLPTTNGAYH